MGSKNAVKPIKSMLFPECLNTECSDVRDAIDRLERRLREKFLDIDDRTSIPHYNFQQAWYAYCGRIVDEISRDHLGKCSDALEGDRYTSLVMNFIGYLKRFGEVRVSSFVDAKDGIDRVGIFLSRNGNPVLIGQLEIKSILGNSIENDNQEFEYSGYVPTDLSESEFFGQPVYHLSSPPKIEGINLVYVRLFAEKHIEVKRDERKESFVRMDGFGDKGISFP